MENVAIQAEFLFELKSKQQWVNRLPNILPEKTRAGEQLIWVGNNGLVFESGKDFMDAEEMGNIYPVRVYRPVSVSQARKENIPILDKEDQLNAKYVPFKDDFEMMWNACVDKGKYHNFDNWWNDLLKFKLEK